MNAIEPSLTLVVVAGFLVAAGAYLLLERALTRVLLGIVLEHLTGRTYTDLVQDRVFDRAGMTASGSPCSSATAAAGQACAGATVATQACRSAASASIPRWACTPART